MLKLFESTLYLKKKKKKAKNKDAASREEKCCRYKSKVGGEAASVGWGRKQLEKMTAHGSRP